MSENPTRVYSSLHLAPARVLQAALSTEGISSELRNEGVVGLGGELAFNDVMVEVWVDAALVEKAQRVIDTLNAAAPPVHILRCSCGADNEATFAVCWQCGRELDDSAAVASPPIPEAPVHARRGPLVALAICILVLCAGVLGVVLQQALAPRRNLNFVAPAGTSETMLGEIAAVLQTRLTVLGVKGRVSVNAERQRIDVRIRTNVNADWVLRTLQPLGRFALRPVADRSTDGLAKIAAPGVRVEEESLYDAHGSTITSYALTAKNEQSLRPTMAAAASSLPPDTELAVGPGMDGVRTYLLLHNSIINNSDVSSAAAEKSDLNAWTTIFLRQQAASRFADFTGGHVGERLAMVLDDWVLMAPIIQERIAGGSLRITGGAQLDKDDEATRTLAALVAAPPLPVEIQFLASP